MPESVQVIYRILKSKKMLHTSDLIKISGYSERTVRSALKKLIDLGLVEKKICIEDLRKPYFQIVS